MLVYPWEQARRRAAREPRADGRTRPEELTIFVALVTAPPQAPFPPRAAGPAASRSSRVAWCGDLAEGERVLAPLRAGCPPRSTSSGRCRTSRCSRCSTQTAPHGWHFYDRLHYLPEVSDGFIDALLAGFERAPDAAGARHDRLDGRRRSTASRRATRRSATAARARSRGSSAARATSRSSPVADWVRDALGGDRAVRDRRRLRQRARRRSARCATRTPTTSGSASWRSSAATTPTASSARQRHRLSAA